MLQPRDLTNIDNAELDISGQTPIKQALLNMTDLDKRTILHTQEITYLLNTSSKNLKDFLTYCSLVERRSIHPLITIPYEEKGSQTTKNMMLLCPKRDAQDY